MFQSLSDRQKRVAYLFSIGLSALLLRVLVGLAHPLMGTDESALVGLTAVVFLAPGLYRAIHGAELLDTRRKRLSHALSMALSAGLFLYYLA